MTFSISHDLFLFKGSKTDVNLLRSSFLIRALFSWFDPDVRITDRALSFVIRVN